MRMNNVPEPAFLNPESRGRASTAGASTAGASTARASTGGPAVCESGAGAGVLKAMSPGVVDFLFRRLVAGEPAEDIQWGREGTALVAQQPGAELARRLAETDLDALTPTELFHYVRAAQRLAAWAESLRESAVGRYCGAAPASSAARARSGGNASTARQDGGA